MRLIAKKALLIIALVALKSLLFFSTCSAAQYLSDDESEKQYRRKIEESRQTMADLMEFERSQKGHKGLHVFGGASPRAVPGRLVEGKLVSRNSGKLTPLGKKLLQEAAAKKAQLRQKELEVQEEQRQLDALRKFFKVSLKIQNKPTQRNINMHRLMAVDLKRNGILTADGELTQKTILMVNRAIMIPCQNSAQKPVELKQDAP
jgi:hypothetical protein